MDLPVVPDVAGAAFLALMSCLPSQSWFSLSDSGGRVTEGYFTVGVNLPSGTVTMTLPSPLVDMAYRTGASSLPLPYNSGTPLSEDLVSTLVRFANR